MSMMMDMEMNKSSGYSLCSVRSFLCLILLLSGLLIGLVYDGFFFLFRIKVSRLIETESERTPNLQPLVIRPPEDIVSFEDIMEDNFSFNMTSKTDVMVFLHIQKTGGTTFGKHLVQDIDLKRPCKCRRPRPWNLSCKCFRPGTRKSNWLFSRFSTGWKCGVHSDWTELINCVNGYMKRTEGVLANNDLRRYFYITFLREPVARYLSEWRHVYRGATWRNAKLKCGGVSWSRRVASCYKGKNWLGVTLDQFMSCPSNLANNRQTRMLADLSLVNCYNTTAMDNTKRDTIMLNSAKANLEAMAYFGLSEEQEKSQHLFEETFNLKFKNNFDQLEVSETHSGHSHDKLDDDVIQNIKNLNNLDNELYKFAKQLLSDRFGKLRKSIAMSHASFQ